MLYLVFIFSITGEVRATDYPVLAHGRVRCRMHGSNYLPVPEVKVMLLDDDKNNDDIMAIGKTDASGIFSLTGYGRETYGGKPDPKIRVEYVYRGKEGNLEIEDEKHVRKDRSKTKRYFWQVDFGFLDFDNAHCRAYVKFHSVLKGYYALGIGKPPFTTLHVKTDVRVSSGAPYAMTNIIRIPKSSDPISLSTAKREFAHTIRHSYDGNLVQFLVNAEKYQYTQAHHCNLNTNLRFAFNEGWARYYAGECTGEYSVEYKCDQFVSIMHLVTSIYIYVYRHSATLLLCCPDPFIWSTIIVHCTDMRMH